MPHLSSWDRGNAASLFDRIRGEGLVSSPVRKRMSWSSLSNGSSNRSSIPVPATAAVLPIWVSSISMTRPRAVQISRGGSARRSGSASVVMNRGSFMWMSVHPTIRRLRLRCRFRWRPTWGWSISSRLPRSTSIWTVTVTTAWSDQCRWNITSGMSWHFCACKGANLQIAIPSSPAFCRSKIPIRMWSACWKASRFSPAICAPR